MDFLKPLEQSIGALDAIKEGGKAIQSIAYLIDRALGPSQMRRKADATSRAIEQVTDSLIGSTERLREAGISNEAIENFHAAMINRQAQSSQEILEHLSEQERIFLEENPESASPFDPDEKNTTDFEDFFWRVISASAFTGDAELQKLWAAVLVRECYHSGSISPKTLDVLRTMTRSDAELFTRYCSILWKISSVSAINGTTVIDNNIADIWKDSQFIVFSIENEENLKKFELQRIEEADLISLGLVPEQYESSTDPVKLQIEQFGRTLVFIPGNSLNLLHSPKGALTRAGEELYPIAAKFNPKYFNAFEGFLREKGLLVE